MIALIPARGGSKGLPNKNIKMLLGKPLIAYTIEAALNSSSIEEVYVSTDDVKIAEIARKYGAKVPFLRPDKLAQDCSKAIDTYLYMLDKWKELGKEVNEFIVLQPTSPLKTTLDIDSAIALFYKNNADSVVSYTKEAHPITWHKYVNEDLSFSSIFEGNLLNRQENRVSYYPNGAIYIFSSSIIKQQKYFSEKSFAYIMERKNSVDIDYIDDFEYATFLLKQKSVDEGI
jgi:N-acylneuraminate cytidylyltransferase/CMP-N,N'-diacetyllegionaminic acid synthase